MGNDIANMLKMVNIITKLSEKSGIQVKPIWDTFELVIKCSQFWESFGALEILFQKYNFEMLLLPRLCFSFSQTFYICSQ